MPQVDVVDETWISARPDVVAAAVADPANWLRWWPSFDLDVRELRGLQGVRWIVRGVGGSPAVGTMEVWLRPDRDGVRLYYFLRLDSLAGRASQRAARRASGAHRRHAKRIFWALKDELEARQR